MLIVCNIQTSWIALQIWGDPLGNLQTEKKKTVLICVIKKKKQTKEKQQMLFVENENAYEEQSSVLDSSEDSENIVFQHC